MENQSKKNKPIRILITGGHLTPALAVIEQLKKEQDHWEIFFIGRKFAEEGSKTLSKESFALIKGKKRATFIFSYILFFNVP